MQISKAFFAICAVATAAVCPSISIAAEPDSPDVAKAREALRQRMAVVSTEEAAGLNDRVATDSEATSQARRALRQRLYETSAAPGFAPVISSVQLPPADSDEAYKAREALRQKMSQVPVEQPAAGQPSVKQSQFRPIEKVPAPISGEKQRKLQELLTKYQANELTPQQYQQERAKILAAP